MQVLPHLPQQHRASTSTSTSTQGRGSEASLLSSGERTEKEWTVLYVFNGDNDLKENTTRQFLELAQAGAPEDSYVATLTARGDLKWAPGNISRKAHWHMGNLIHGRPKPVVAPNWEGLKRFEVGPRESHGGVAKEIGEVQGAVSDPATIKDFLTWGMKEYPSKRVAVIFSGHGDGHHGTLMDGKGRQMSLSALGQVMDEVVAERGRPIDVIGFESCNMAQTEIAYEFHRSAEAMVASPTVLTGHPWDHPSALGAIAGAKSGREAVERLAESAESFGAGTPTYTAIDLTRMPQLAEQLDLFADAMMEANFSESVLERMIYNARSYGQAGSGSLKPQREFVDLHSFCDQVLHHEASPAGAHKVMAKKVQEELAQAIVGGHDHTPYAGEGAGMAIYLPTLRGIFQKLPPAYQDLAMSAEGRWDSFLANY